MPTVRLLVAYEGTRYGGWQRQQNAPTIQAALEGALRRITGRRVTVIGAGRTDAGVHAWGQVAHAQLRTRLTPATLQRALNDSLPTDILIRRVSWAPDRFHAQFDATAKWYRYRLATGSHRSLFERSCVYYVPQPLNLRAMRRAAAAWVGRHDFRAFHSAGSPVRSTRRTISNIRITRWGRELQIDVIADGFLYHMVRRMVGALLNIGQGRWPASAAAALLTRQSPSYVPPTAPAKGLCLMQVSYPTPSR